MFTSTNNIFVLDQERDIIETFVNNAVKGATSVHFNIWIGDRKLPTIIWKRRDTRWSAGTHAFMLITDQVCGSHRYTFNDISAEGENFIRNIDIHFNK